MAITLLCCVGCGAGDRKEAQSVPRVQQQRSAELTQRGLRFLASGLQDQAAAVLEEAWRADPRSSATGLALARAYRLQSRYQSAKKTLEEVMQSPRTPADGTAAREALVGVFLESGNLEAAEAACRPLLETSRPSAESLRLAGVIAYRKGNMEDARQRLEASIRLDPLSAAARVDLGLALLQSRQVNQAAGSLEEALRLDPESQTAMLNLAKAYERLGRAEEASRMLRRYREVYDLKSVRQKIGPLRAKAMKAYGEGKLDEALAAFNEVLRLVPGDPQALAQTGSVLLALQRLDEAQANLERSLSILPKNDFALTELARVHALRDDLPGAVDLLQKAVQANPTAPEPHYFLAGIYLAQGRQQDFEREKKAYLQLQSGAGPNALRPLPGGDKP